MVKTLVFSKGVVPFQTITETIYDIFEDHFKSDIEFYKICGVKDDLQNEEFVKRGKAIAKAKKREERIKSKNKTSPTSKQKTLSIHFRKDAYFESAFVSTEKNSEDTFKKSATDRTNETNSRRATATIKPNPNFNWSSAVATAPKKDSVSKKISLPKKSTGFGLSTRIRNKQLLFYFDTDFVPNSLLQIILQEIEEKLCMDYSVGKAKIYFFPKF